jgi:hypothetical protein
MVTDSQPQEIITVEFGREEFLLSLGCNLVGANRGLRMFHSVGIFTLSYPIMMQDQYLHSIDFLFLDEGNREQEVELIKVELISPSKEWSADVRLQALKPPFTSDVAKRTSNTTWYRVNLEYLLDKIQYYEGVRFTFRNWNLTT